MIMAMFLLLLLQLLYSTVLYVPAIHVHISSQDVFSHSPELDWNFSSSRLPIVKLNLY